MLKNWKLAIAVPVASAAVLAGCSNDSGKGDRGAIQDTGAKNANARPVALTGCVSTGTGNDQYMLTNVRFAPLAQQPSDAQSYQGTGLTEHSQVRLAIEDRDQLRKLVGQMASVTGTLRDDGRNTIGTTGPAAGPNDPGPAQDQSQQATKQSHSEKAREEAGPIGTRSMNNGTFPEILVQQVNGNGQPCQTQPVQDKR